MAGCVYADPDAGPCPITAPPVTVGGLPWPVVLLDSHVRIGAITQNYHDCLKAIIRSFRHREPPNILKELP